MPHLVIHELQREGGLPHSAAAHHDHLMEGQRGLVLVLAGGHVSGLRRSSSSQLCLTTEVQQGPAQDER